MTKRSLAVLAVIAATGVILAGCSPATPTPKGDVTLTFLTFETPNLTAKYWDDVIARTNEAVPGVKIDKLVAPNSTQRDEFARQLDSTGSLPDIMAAVDPAGLAQAGKLAEFTKSDLKDFVDPTSNSFDGKTYQLPTGSQTWQVYYHKDQFAKAGIDSPPTTWDDLLADAAKLKSAGTTPFVIGGGAPSGRGPRWLFQQIVATDVYAQDPKFLAKLAAGKTDFSNPLFVNALKKVKQLVDEGLIDQTLLSNNYADAQTAFLDGKGAMYPMGSWFAVTPKGDQQDEIGVFSLPGDDGGVVLPVFTGGGLSVSSSAPDVDKAKQWALAFSKLNAEGAARTDGLFVALKGFTPPTDMPKLYNEVFALYQSALDKGTVTTDFGTESGTVALPAGMIAEVDAALIDLLSGRSDVDKVVDDLNTKLATLTQ